MLLFHGYASALNPTIRLEDYNHTKWTTRDGAPAAITSMAQTTDGWLWLGTPNGLYRFDGLRFERFKPPGGGDIQIPRIYGLIAQPNGDLYISYMVGSLSVLHKNGVIEHFPAFTPEMGGVRTVVVDKDGSLWVTTPTGLYRYFQGRLQRFGEKEGFSEPPAINVLIDQYDQLWASSDKGLYLLNRSSGKFEKIAMENTAGSLIQSPDGRIWVAGKDRVQLVPNPAATSGPSRPRPADFNQRESRYGGQFDRDGNLWASLCPRGICLLAGAGHTQETQLIPSRQATDKFDQPWQMTALVAIVVLEDREGNIWIATQRGLERLRENKIVSAKLPENKDFSMARDGSGQVWAVDRLAETAWQLFPNAPPLLDPLKSQPYQFVAHDRDGALLLAGKREIERRYKGEIQKIPYPPGRDGKPVDMDVAGIMDDGKVLWMATRQTGLIGLVEGKWLPRAKFNLPPRIFLSVRAAAGQLWLACADGSINFYDNDKLTRYDGSHIGLATGIFVGPKLLVASDKGLAVLEGTVFRPLKVAEPDVLSNISGMAVTEDGDHWFNGGKGIIHVRRDDWQAVMDNPEASLRYELIDVLEGYPGQADLLSRLSTILVDPNGLLWILTTEGMVRLDTRQIKRNMTVPKVEILGLNAGALAFPAQPGLRLPPASQSFNIQFTTPLLTKPERARMQYQLVGVDATWQEAGPRRTAYYTNVEPGSYRFLVKAINEDGVGSDGEAALSFEIEPTFMQTWWFKALCLLAITALLYLLYLYRLRIATARMMERFDVRTAERERIARTLHDTFLQSIHAIVLRFHLVAMEMPEHSNARNKLLNVLSQADEALNEGRSQVHELRNHQLGDIEVAISEASQLLMEAHPGIVFHLNVKGTRIPLQAQANDEASGIACESLRNAFLHAGGSTVHAQLEYADTEFTLLVTDDGKGISEEVLKAGSKPLHWGMTGMRERAARIGARLEIGNGANGGARVALIIPARRAYVRKQRSWLRWWRSAK
ncbi:histidine kinase [Undibacterium terreum]|uniref:Histidine kinase n=2 Tax=Undibacterium terreum TaxID=1224302 RepID=A0A916UBI4_9BURK|nr:histidine kinase [Undibacterium terreum]